MKAIKSNNTNATTNFQTVFEGNSKNINLRQISKIFSIKILNRLATKFPWKFLDKLAKYFSLKNSKHIAQHFFHKNFRPNLQNTFP